MGRKLSITAFVLSLLFFIPFVPIIGFILGIIALKKAKDRLSNNLAIAAMIIGAIFGIFNLFTSLGLVIGFLRGTGLI